MRPLTFTTEHLSKTPTRGIDAETTLQHFAIVTYLVEPSALRKHIHDRFDLDCIRDDNGRRQALLSVVPFLDADFHFANFPWLQWSFGQTNYRAYVVDGETGEHVVWFFGTALDSVSVNVPRYLWKLPWHRANISFDCLYDQHEQRYRRYRVESRSRWAPATLELQDTGQPPRQLSGFPDLESGLVLMTHPLVGYFYRSDGRLGTYRIWHDRLRPTVGHVVGARFPLLDRLQLVPRDDASTIHSVLLQPSTEFTIYLPPRLVKPNARSINHFGF